MSDRESGYRLFGVVFVLIGLVFFAYFWLFGLLHVQLFGLWFYLGIVVCSIILVLLGVVLLFYGSFRIFQVSLVFFGYLVFSIIVFFFLLYGISPG